LGISKVQRKYTKMQYTQEIFLFSNVKEKHRERTQ